MIATLEQLRATAVLIDNLGSPMATAVKQDVHFAGCIAAHDDRTARYRSRDVVSRRAHLAFVTNKHPEPAKNPLHFQFEKIWVGVHIPMDAIFLY